MDAMWFSIFFAGVSLIGQAWSQYGRRPLLVKVVKFQNDPLPMEVAKLRKIIPPSTAQPILEKLIRESDKRKRAQEMAAKATANFREFIPMAWPIVEPEHPFIPSWHIDAMCLPGDSLIQTEDGLVEIGKLDGYRGRILSFDHSTDEMTWKAMVRWVKSPGRPVRKLKTSDGKSVTITDNHPVFVIGRGYTPASEVCLGDAVIVLRTLRETVQQKAQKACDSVLQYKVVRPQQDDFTVVREMRRSALMGNQIPVPSVLSEPSEDGKSEWPRTAVPSLREAGLSKSGPLEGLSEDIRRVLQSRMLRGVCDWEEQPCILQWTVYESLSFNFPLRKKEGHEPGRACLFRMRERGCLDEEEDHALQFRGSPHRQESEEQRHDEPRYGVPKVPSQAGEPRGSVAVIRSVEREVSTPDWVYNIEVADNHNYFAGGILVHNCDHLQAMVNGHIRNLMILVPPGSAKSVCSAVMLPAWQWLPGRKPGWRSTWASYDADLSTRDSVRCRGLLQSVWYQETFRPNWKFASDQNEKTYYVNSAKGFRVSTSVSGRGTGWRGSLIAADDPLNAKERNSEPTLRECIDWWENVVFNRLDDMATDNKLVIMQRLGARDLAGHILSRGGYEVLTIPLEYDPKRSRVTTLAPGIEWRDPRQAGDIMCPEKFPPHVVEEIKAKPLTWETQYQQNPQAEGGGILKPHKWRYWQPAGLGLPAVRVKMPDGTIEERAAVDLPTSFDVVLQSWDFAFKDTKNSDYVAGQVHAVRGANRYILDQDHGRMDFPKSLQAVRRMTGRHPSAHLKLVEDKANGSAIIATLKDEVPGLVEVNPEDGKVGRAAAASVELESGNWYLPHPMLATWVGNPESPEDGGGFLAETVAFPPVPGVGHDDMVDAWSQGAIRIQKEQIGGVFGVSESDIRVDVMDLKLIEKWPKIYGLSVTWREVAAVWLTRQPETGQHYLYAEYCAPAADPAQHAAAVRLLGDQQGYMVSKDVGRDIKDGYAVAGAYRKLGLKIETIQNNEDAALVELADGLRSGKLKVFSNCPRFFDEFRMYRRSEKTGKLPQENVGVIMATLVAWKSKDKMREPIDPNKKAPSRLFRDTTSGQGWMQS